MTKRNNHVKGAQRIEWQSGKNKSKTNCSVLSVVVSSMSSSFFNKGTIFVLRSQDAVSPPSAMQLGSPPV